MKTISNKTIFAGCVVFVVLAISNPTTQDHAQILKSLFITEINKDKEYSNAEMRRIDAVKISEMVDFALVRENLIIFSVSRLQIPNQSNSSDIATIGFAGQVIAVH